MDSGGRIEKITAGNTQGTSADKALSVATERCQRVSTRLFCDGQILRTVATMRRNYAMHRILQKGEHDDIVTVKFKSMMTFKTMRGEPKLPNQKQSTLQSNRGISQINPGNSKYW